MDMYYYVLHVTNFVAVATIYIVNFVKTLQKSEEKDSPCPISAILIADRQIWYVCEGLHLLSSKVPFYLIFGKYSCLATVCTLTLCGKQILY